MDWQDFEINTTKYLNDTYGNSSLVFIHEGGFDSCKPDIYVYRDEDNIFNIECKFKKSQSSQFVLLEDPSNKTFSFSSKNKSNEDDAEELIIHVNQNYDYYSKKKSTNRRNNKLICDQDIINNYMVKNLSRKSSIIITSDFTNNFSDSKPLTISKIVDIPINYNTTGTYRTKQSGTRNANNNDIRLLNLETEKINNKIFVCDPDQKLNSYQDNNVFLSKVNSDGLREVRKRSKTYNSNIIFSLSLNDEAKIHTPKCFLSDILN